MKSSIKGLPRYTTPIGWWSSAATQRTMTYSPSIAMGSEIRWVRSAGLAGGTD